MRETRYRRKGDIHFGPLHDEWLGIDAEAGYCYSLNESGGMVWQLLDHPSTAAEICQGLCWVFQVPADQCLADVERLLRELEEAGLVTRDLDVEEPIAPAASALDP